MSTTPTITDTCQVTLERRTLHGQLPGIVIPDVPATEVPVLQSRLRAHKGQVTIALYDIIEVWAQTALPDHGDQLLPQLWPCVGTNVKLSLGFEDTELLVCTIGFDVTIKGTTHFIDFDMVEAGLGVKLLEDRLEIHDYTLTPQLLSSLRQWAMTRSLGLDADDELFKALDPHKGPTTRIKTDVISYSTRPYVRPQAAG
jgi:hypothetical protein